MAQEVVLKLTGDASGLKRALDTVDKELADVVKQADRAQAVLGAGMSKATKTSVKAANQYSGAMNKVFKTSGQARAGVQNLGFQMQDIAVQAEMGTHWTRIFAQQGTQILGVFGPMATILGAAAAGIIAAGNAMGWFSTETIDATKELEKFTESSNKLLEIERLLDVATRNGADGYNNLLSAMKAVEEERLRLAKEQLTAAIGLNSAIVKNIAANQVAAQLQLEQVEFAHMGLETLNEAFFTQQRFNRVIEASVADRAEVLKTVLEELRIRGVLTEEVRNMLVLIAEQAGVQEKITTEIEKSLEVSIRLKKVMSDEDVIMEMVVAKSAETLAIEREREAVNKRILAAMIAQAQADAAGANNGGLDPNDPRNPNSTNIFGNSQYEWTGSGWRNKDEKDPTEKKGGSTKKTQAEKDADAIAKAVKKAREEYAAAIDVQEQWNEVLVQFGDGAVNGFVDALFDAEKSFKDFARTLLIDMGKIIVKQIIMNALMRAFGGGADTAGLAEAGSAANVIQSIAGITRVTPYAKGGVVNGATAFPMSGGNTGLMGEAGPEAIMPLATNNQGKLGVAGPSIRINNYSGQEVQVTRSDDEVIEIAVGKARNAVAQDYAQSMQSGHGTYANAMEQSYSSRRRAY